MEDQYKEASLVKCCGKYPLYHSADNMMWCQCPICGTRTAPQITGLAANFEWNKTSVTRMFRQFMHHTAKKYILALYMQDGMTMKEIGNLFQANRFKVSAVLSTFSAFRERENERNREPTWEDRLLELD